MRLRFGVAPRLDQRSDAHELLFRAGAGEPAALGGWQRRQRAALELDRAFGRNFLVRTLESHTARQTQRLNQLGQGRGIGRRRGLGAIGGNRVGAGGVGGAFQERGGETERHSRAIERFGAAIQMFAPSGDRKLAIAGVVCGFRGQEPNFGEERLIRRRTPQPIESFRRASLAHGTRPAPSRA